MKRLVFTVLVLGAGSALADPTPNYFYAYPSVSVGDLSGSHTAGSPFENNFGPLASPPNDLQSAAVSDLAGSSATASIAEAPVALTAVVTAGTGAGYYMQTAQASAQLWWTIDVVGGAAPVTFKALLNTTGSTIGDGISAYESHAALSVDFTTLLGSACSSTFQGACASGETATLNLDQSVLLTAGSHTVIETVSGYATDQGAGSASADPMIFIDPAFLTSHPGYALATPPGLSGPVAAPEPATWALMLTGLCLMGGALRRRRVA